jgi:hypothetical protein
MHLPLLAHRLHRHRSVAALILGMTLAAWPIGGRCWGEEGHEIVGLIAEQYLRPEVRVRVDQWLAGDTSALTPTDLTDETVWADRFRDSDRETSRLHYAQTFQWHFVDIEVESPDLDAACHGHPRLAPGTAASAGPAAACIVDKIDQFRAELRSPATPPAERRLALQFLVHLLGDLHQPLHVADHHDRGGNDVRVASGRQPPGNLHHYWDTVFVMELGASKDEVASRLIAGLSPEQRRAYAGGSVTDWAWETFAVGKLHAYAELPPATRGVVPIDDAYDADARRLVAVQLQRAGVRLAQVLNDALR